MSDRKEDILEAALDEFGANSYDNASINAIIKNSKTSKGTFYHYFSDKKELYLQVMKRAAHTKWEYISQAGIAPSDEQKDIFDLFKQQVEYGIRFGNDFPRYDALNKQLLKEKETNSPMFDLVQQELMLDQEDVLEQLFVDAYERGEFNTQFSVEFILKTTLYLINHFDDIYTRKDGKLEESLQDLYKLIEFLKSGFGG